MSILSGRGGPQKLGEAMADPTSTGRKRAAVRISDDYLGSKPPCSWTGLLYAGGGVSPIVGCKGNVATDRHHGPDKSVLNNDDALPSFGVNLHAICDWCHNRWHAVNDKYYIPTGWKKGDPDPRPEKGRPWLPNIEYSWRPHDPVTQAPPELIAQHEAWWALNTRQREELGIDFHEYAKRTISDSRPKQSDSQRFGQGASGHSSDQDRNSDPSA